MTPFIITILVFAAIIAFFYITGTMEERKQKTAWQQGVTPAGLDWDVLLSDAIQECLPHQKIEAIKRYREQTSVGLKDAKDAIEYMMAYPERRPSHSAADPAAPRKAKPLVDGIDWDVLLSPAIQACLPDNKIEAIKRYREHTGAGLKEAKDAIEQYIANPTDVPAKIRRYDLADQQADGIRDLLREGQRDEAQRIYQAFTGVDVFTARDALDALEDEMHEDEHHAANSADDAAQDRS